MGDYLTGLLGQEKVQLLEQTHQWKDPLGHSSQQQELKVQVDLQHAQISSTEVNSRIVSPYLSWVII